MTSTRRTISIITVAYNESLHVRRLKRSIDRLHSVRGVRAESILVDSGSQDDTPSIARHCSFSKVVEVPSGNIPICRNVGLQQATGDWVAFIDADCEMSPEWLTKVLRFLEHSEPLIVGWPVAPPFPGTWVQRAWHVHWLHKNLKYEDFLGERVVRREAFRLVTTANMAMHREVAEILEGFDESLATGEDTDFVLRAHDRGFPIVAVPGLTVTHHGEPATLRQFVHQQMWHAKQSRKIQRIRRSTSIRGRGSAFVTSFMVSFVLFMIGLVCLAMSNQWWTQVLLYPLPVLVGVPAFIIACRAHRPQQALSLCILYLAYAFARSLARLGLLRSEKSWR